MPERYVAFDVETPNDMNNRISAVGLTVVENGEITDEFYSLVNPETHFNSFNIHLTGIDEELVRDKPTFPEIWEKLEPYFGNSVIAAHSAQFDMSVLAKCLRDYGIYWKPYARYLCTCTMGRDCLPGMPNYKLNTLCSELCIALDHHNAGSDSRACAELLRYYIGLGADVCRYIRKYDIAAVKTLHRR